MTEDPTPYNGNAPGEPETDIVTLEAPFDQALLGHTPAFSGPARAVYSLTRMTHIEMRRGKVDEEPARLALLEFCLKVAEQHGEKAPVFVADEEFQPKKVQAPERRIIRPPGGFRPGRR